MFTKHYNQLSPYFTLLFYIFAVFNIAMTGLYYVPEFDFLPEFALFNNIVIGFIYFLLKSKASKPYVFYSYLGLLIISFFVYIILSCCELFLTFGASFNAFFLMDQATIQIKILIAVFYLFFLFIFRLEFRLVRFYNLELLFIFALLAWTSILSSFTFNFVFLFLTMELLTILLVILMAIYFIFVGTKLLKPVTQFFILNVVISVFFLLGFCLLLYSLVYFNTFNASYLILVNTYINYTILGVSATTLLIFFKFISALFLLPFIFKLTFAPFSIWIINIYTHLPLVLLMLLMTVYKIIYSFIYIRLFLGILDVLALDPFINFSNILFICFIIPSLFVGCLAFKQLDFKTFLAYTTVSQLGYIFTGILTTNVLAVAQSLAYLLVYCLHLLLIFSIFVVVKKKYSITNINQLFIIKFYDQYLFYTLLFIIFSLAGIPPLGGFAIKIYLFLQVYAAGHQILAVVSLFSSFVMSIIYLKISIKLFLSKNTFYSTLQHITYKKEFLFQHTISSGFILGIYSFAFIIFNYFIYADLLTFILVDLVKQLVFYI